MDPFASGGVRVVAPELAGAGGWIGSAPLTLADLRGRIVVLHFWTAGCVNCHHVVEELRGIERRFAASVTVVSVHSPKFAHETEHDAVRSAAARMRIDHPVLDDPGLITWDAYAVRAWPSLVLIDQSGRVVGTAAGEGHRVALAAAIERLLADGGGAAGPGPEHLLDPEPVRAGRGELAFPGGIAVGPRSDGRPVLVVADTGHDRVLVCELDGEVLAAHDGFYRPHGVAIDGDALLVCETGHDRVWRVTPGGERQLITDRVKSPWDVVRWQGHVVVAGAGRHVLCAVDAEGETQVIAGNGAEGLRDGPALGGALLAQPSGLAITPHDELVFVDAESSALRVLDRPGAVVRTLVGEDLFEWGAADGNRDRARLQHPLAVAAAPDGAVYVADTYNDAVRVWRGDHLWTVPVAGFSEPGAITVLPDGRLVVADTGNHRIVTVEPRTAHAEVVDVGRPGARTPAPLVASTAILAEGADLDVVIDVPLDGDALDPSGGAPVRVRATASDEGLLGPEREWTSQTLPARVTIPLGHGSGRIVVEVLAATCGPDACRLRRTARAYDVVLT